LNNSFKSRQSGKPCGVGYGGVWSNEWNLLSIFD
jgi:hypothetical protein